MVPLYRADGGSDFWLEDSACAANDGNERHHHLEAGPEENRHPRMGSALPRWSRLRLCFRPVVSLRAGFQSSTVHAPCAACMAMASLSNWAPSGILGAANLLPGRPRQSVAIVSVPSTVARSSHPAC